MRFELTKPFSLLVFKTSAIGHSATLPVIETCAINYTGSVQIISQPSVTLSHPHNDPIASHATGRGQWFSRSGVLVCLNADFVSYTLAGRGSAKVVATLDQASSAGLL